MQAAELLLKELQEAKVMLDDDWRCKNAAFKIDQSCRNLTPIRAATMFKAPDSPSATQTTRLDSTDFPMNFADGNDQAQEDDYGEFE